MIQQTLNTLCKLIGHSWRYKDYSNWIKDNGDRYDFKASRKCSRCAQKEYLFQDWEIANQNSPLDVELDSQASKHLQQSI